MDKSKAPAAGSHQLTPPAPFRFPIADANVPTGRCFGCGNQDSEAICTQCQLPFCAGTGATLRTEAAGEGAGTCSLCMLPVPVAPALREGILRVHTERCTTCHSKAALLVCDACALPRCAHCARNENVVAFHDAFCKAFALPRDGPSEDPSVVRLLTLADENAYAAVMLAEYVRFYSETAPEMFVADSTPATTRPFYDKLRAEGLPLLGEKLTPFLEKRLPNYAMRGTGMAEALMLARYFAFNQDHDAVLQFLILLHTLGGIAAKVRAEWAMMRMKKELPPSDLGTYCIQVGMNPWAYRGVSYAGVGETKVTPTAIFTRDTGNAAGACNAFYHISLVSMETAELKWVLRDRKQRRAQPLPPKALVPFGTHSLLVHVCSTGTGADDVRFRVFQSHSILYSVKDWVLGNPETVSQHKESARWRGLVHGRQALKDFAKLLEMLANPETTAAVRQVAYAELTGVYIDRPLPDPFYILTARLNPAS